MEVTDDFVLLDDRMDSSNFVGLVVLRLDGLVVELFSVTVFVFGKDDEEETKFLSLAVVRADVEVGVTAFDDVVDRVEVGLDVDNLTA